MDSADTVDTAAGFDLQVAREGQAYEAQVLVTPILSHDMHLIRVVHGDREMATCAMASEIDELAVWLFEQILGVRRSRASV